MRLYISGPMTGHPEYNYPAFHAAARRLRGLGHQVENPAEGAVRNPPACGTWEGYMRNALGQMLTCDAIVRLPGWQKSRGARIEIVLGKILGMAVTDAEDWG